MAVKDGKGRVVYDSWKDGSDVLKDRKGYYVMQWNPKTGKDYKKHLPKTWKPSPEEDKETKAAKRRRAEKRRAKKRKAEASFCMVQ